MIITEIVKAVNVP